MLKVILAIVCCLFVAGFVLNEAAKGSYPAQALGQCTPQNPFVDLMPECGGMKPAYQTQQPPQAERTDIYQQSLQILSGEKLTPLN